MTLIDTEPTPHRPGRTRHRRLYRRPGRRAAVVAILVGALVLAGRSDPTEPQIPAATTSAPTAAGARPPSRSPRSIHRGS